jgi:hypothetical protein
MMDSDRMAGRTPALGQMLEAWVRLAGPRTWSALKHEIGGLVESACLIRWADPGAPVIDEAGAQAVLAYAAALAGAPVEVLTPGRPDAAREAAAALSAGRPFTAEDDVGDGAATRRIARLYLPLDESPPAVACGVARID